MPSVAISAARNISHSVYSIILKVKKLILKEVNDNHKASQVLCCMEN